MCGCIGVSVNGSANTNVNANASLSSCNSAGQQVNMSDFMSVSNAQHSIFVVKNKYIHKKHTVYDSVIVQMRYMWLKVGRQERLNTLIKHTVTCVTNWTKKKYIYIYIFGIPKFFLSYTTNIVYDANDNKLWSLNSVSLAFSILEKKKEDEWTK